MYTFYGLVVSLIVFEAFVIQSDAMVDRSGKVLDEVELPYEVIGNILHKAGYIATKGAGRSRALMAASRDAMSRIFEDRILVFGNFTNAENLLENAEFTLGGKTYFLFANFAQLKSHFQTYGKYARRILINYEFLTDTIRRDINKNILSKYAEYFTELRLYVDNDSGLWEDMSNKNGQIRFPNVKEFIYVCVVAGRSSQSFDLNSIFPKLESFKLIGSVGDGDCLENVMKLKELTLLHSSIPEFQFEDIFEKNKQISKLTISPESTKTLKLIEKYLKDLQTLKVKGASDEFLRVGKRVYNLPSVKSLVVDIGKRRHIPGRSSFKMPNLKKLSVYGEFDEELSDFINQFEKLDSVEIISYEDTYEAVECLKKLANVKEHIFPFQCSELAELKDFFKKFDKAKSKLSTLKLMCLDDNLEVDRSKKIMNKINAGLKPNKPKWTLTDGVEKETNINYLIINRNL